MNNIKILLDNGNVLDYENDTGLGIKLNRIVDDLRDISKRFGEFSYSLSLPKTKNNRKCFEFPDVKGRREIFKGKSFGCQVFNNNVLLLDGIIELSGYDSDTYKCVFYSSFTQLVDELKGKKLVDGTFLPTIEWNYEQTIKTHLDANYQNADETDFQFIYSFYKTPFMLSATTTSDTSSELDDEVQFGVLWNNINSSLNWGKKNPFFYERFPPAIYLKSIFKGIINDAGFSLGGTFFENADIKKIIIPFAGNPEDFSGAIQTGTTNYLNLNKILPDVDQVTFLTSVINAFNLYFTIDPVNKSISFETYNVLFNDLSNPYDLTYKIDASTIDVSNADTDTKITFTEDDSNNLVMGYGRWFDYDRVLAGEKNPTDALCENTFIRRSISIYFAKINEQYSKNAFSNLWNKTTGDKEIKLAFSPANYFSYTLLNETNIAGVNYSSAKYPTPALTIGIPLLSDQTPLDNKDNPFSEDDQDYCSGNGPENMKYPGKMKMYFYYGPTIYDYVLTGATSSSEEYKTYSYFLLATSGGTCSAPNFYKNYITSASPFKLMSNYQKSILMNRISGFTWDDKSTEIAAEAHGLLQTYMTNGTLSDVHEPTAFSLTMGDSDFTFPNLYTYFHKNKFDTLRDSSLLTANMRMNANDWQEMQVSRPLSYDNELYRLISIQNFDPVGNTAKVTLLKV